jgi:MoaA/NifB/PqqE/SkfB family radical SAM enzyme
MLRHLSFVRTLFRNRHRVEDPPRFLTHTVTFGCNARCIMCDSWKMPTDGDLTTDEIERIYRQLPPMDAVRLTGGEPFVRRDMPEIAEFARRHLRPLVLHITTNGFLTKRIVEFVEQRDRRLPLELLVSLDGVKEKHNEVRGRENAWDTAIKTVRELAPRRKELRLVLRVNQTIVDADGVEQYRRLREVLRPLGVRNNVVLAYDTSATYNMERELDVAPTEIGEFTTFGEFTRDDLRDLIGEVERDLADAPLLERLSKRYYLRGIANRLLNHRGSPNPACVALHSHLRLFPNGDVPTCQFNSRTVGNLRQSSFAEVWKSVKADEQRQWVRKCPGCWAECEVLPSAIYTGDLLFHSTLPIQDRRPERSRGTATAATVRTEGADDALAGAAGGCGGGCGAAEGLVELRTG